MSLSTVVATVERKDFLSPGIEQVTGTIAIGASPLTYPTGGLDISAIFAGLIDGVTIIDARIFGLADGYIYQWDKANAKLKIIDTTAGPNAEFAAGATPAAISGDTIRFVIQVLIGL